MSSTSPSSGSLSFSDATEVSAGTPSAADLRLALAGGGTGGHVVPGMHMLRHLQSRGGLESLIWFGAGRAAEERALAGIRNLLADGVEFQKTDLPLESEDGGAPRWRDLAIRIAPATRMARQALLDHRSQVVCGLGGFTSLPVVLAARSLKLPVALLEINAVQGKATRWLSPIVQRVLHAWPSTLPGRVRVKHDDGPQVGKHRLIGPPLSPGFTGPTLTASERQTTVAVLGFAAERPLIVLLGGSQGAQSLNRFMRERAADVIRCGLSILHQVGPGRLSECASEQEHYRGVEYIDDVAGSLRAASLVVCRGGASTLAEVAAAGTPAVVVPYPHHPDHHQRANAEALGEGVLVMEEQEGLDALFKCVLELAADVGERERRGEFLRQSVPIDGAERLFEELSLLSTSRVSHD